MAIMKVQSKDSHLISSVADVLAAAKKVVVITGAGISTNCGIPDFRSQDGLYKLIRTECNKQASKNSTPRPASIKGADLFDSSLWKDEHSTSVFYSFIANLRDKIRDDVKRTSATHKFIKTLRDQRKLVRCYTQNIDGLEARDDLATDLSRGKGNRVRFSKKASGTPIPYSTMTPEPGTPFDGGCEVVQLHGELSTLRCTLCSQTCDWDTKKEQIFLSGKAPECRLCQVLDEDRRNRGKRGTAVGVLRPNIVLYGEENPAADAISSLTQHDLALAPDVLLILGTSLKVHGLKVLVKEFAKAVHAKSGGKGKVIFVNDTAPADSVWKKTIDYWVSMDCDEWVASVKKCRPDLWEVEEAIGLEKQEKVKSKFAPIENTENFAPSTPARSSKNMAIIDLTLTPQSRGNTNHARRILTPRSKESQGLQNLQQLATPPASKHTGSMPERPNDECFTPSKKQKRKNFDIFEDGSEPDLSGFNAGWGSRGEIAVAVVAPALTPGISSRYRKRKLEA